VAQPALSQTTKGEKQSKDTKTAVSDSWITSKTKIALFADERVPGREVSVETVNGVVSLRGKVDSADAKMAAEQVAQGIEGVKHVKNELQVIAPAQRDRVDAKDNEITKQVKRRISEDPRFKGADIKVDTTNGVVRLTGDVPNVTTAARASEMARQVTGVRAVKNELTVKSGARSLGALWALRRP
jgi:hyperosmotically inducible protein